MVDWIIVILLSLVITINTFIRYKSLFGRILGIAVSIVIAAFIWALINGYQIF